MTVLAVSQGLLDQPGTGAFLVVFGMGVLLFFLFRSMSRHLRKVSMAARAEAEQQARGDADAQAADGQAAMAADSGAAVGTAGAGDTA